MLTYDPNDSLRLPEGHYIFQVREEPEARKQTSDKGNEYIYYIFKFTATDHEGISRKYNDIFVRWDERFGALLTALGAKPDKDGKLHLSETDTVGKQFEADIEHRSNPKKPGEVQDKIVNIIVSNDVPPPNETEKDEVPF